MLTRIFAMLMRRLRQQALWFFAAVAVISASLALYVMAWAAFGAPDYFPLNQINGEIADVAPLMVGSLGVLATVCAIFAGILELEHALPRQTLKISLILHEDDASRDRLFAYLTAQAQRAITSQAKIEWRWSEPDRSIESAEHATLFPGAEPWLVASLRISPTQLEDGVSVEARWWTDRSSGPWQTLHLGSGDAPKHH